MAGSEQFLGRVLQDGYRGKVKLATKDAAIRNAATWTEFSRFSQRTSDDFEANQWKILFDWCFRIPGFGKVAVILGMWSFLPRGSKTFKEIIDAYDWVFCQIQYNFLDETNVAGTIRCLKEYRGYDYGATPGWNACR